MHAPAGFLSSWHVNVEPGTVEWKVKVAVVDVVPSSGPVSMRVSGTGGVVTVTAAVAADWLPAASMAATAYEWVLDPWTASL